MNAILLSIILIPIVEIYLFIEIGGKIGAFNTISLIFITAFVGVLYARYEGFNTLRSAMSQMVKNELPIYEIISGAALAFAATGFRLTPGRCRGVSRQCLYGELTACHSPDGKLSHGLPPCNRYQCPQ